MVEFRSGITYVNTKTGAEIWLKQIRKGAVKIDPIIQAFADLNWDKSPFKNGLTIMLQENFAEISFIPQSLWNKLTVRWWKDDKPNFWYVRLNYRPDLGEEPWPNEKRLIPLSDS